MRLRGAISPRPEMRKNVTAITAQRAAMWKDHHQGDPDASTISPKAVRNTPNAAKSSPASAGFSFSCGIGAVKRPSQPAARACAQAHRLTSYEQRIISIEPAGPGERFELPTNGLQNRCSTTELTRQINELGSTPHPIRYAFATIRFDRAASSAPSTRADASSCMPGRTCEYKSRVIPTLLCSAQPRLAWVYLARPCNSRWPTAWNTRRLPSRV